MKKISLRATAVAVAALATTSAFATDGYFPHGYGMKALGMGGASVAMTDNAFAGANNPATAAFSDSRLDLGTSLFMPNRSAGRTGATMSTMDGSSISGSKYFFIPEMGYVRQISSQQAVGVTVYGNGGMNTDYATGGYTCYDAANSNAPYSANLLCGTTKLGVNLQQLVVAPFYSVKIDQTSSFGVAPLIVYQTFKASGLQAFAGNPDYAANPPSANTTDNGTDSSSGLGLRLGYFKQINSQVDFGVSYSPRINMTRFKKYSELFAEAGDFDIPANFTIGLAVQATPAVKLAMDYQKISYKDVAATGNIMRQGGHLGDANGPGFGWSDVNVLKLGAEWKYAPELTLRAGYNHANNPINPNSITFNIIAPAVVQDHFTLGFTKVIDKHSEVTMAYMYAPKKSLSATSGMDPSSTETISMSQQQLGVQYSWKF